MKTYVFTLTDKARVLPDEFVPSSVSTISDILVSKGGFNLQYGYASPTVENHLAEIGFITASFVSEQKFEPIDGILTIEEKTDQPVTYSLFNCTQN